MDCSSKGYCFVFVLCLTLAVMVNTFSEIGYAQSKTPVSGRTALQFVEPAEVESAATIPTQATDQPAMPVPKASEPAAVQSAEKPTAKDEKYDPIKENGEYFVGWEKPKLAIVLTGLLNGYIEPCGCAGMDRMKGGLSRRNTFLKDLAQRGWPLVRIDSGQISDGFGVQEELKFDMAYNAFRLMSYQAIGIGRNELKFPAYFLLTFTAPTGAGEPSPFVSANVAMYGFNRVYTLPYKVIEAEGMKIGVTSVLFPAESLKHRDENILLEDPYKKLQAILPELKRERCDQLILMVDGSEKETSELARRFPEFGIVLTSDGPSTPPAEVREINNTQLLIELGEKGKYAIVLGLYGDSKNPIRYQRVALDSRYIASKDIHLLMENYQKILRTLIETKGYNKGLGLSLVAAPQESALGTYVGSAKCESCHEESYRIWRRNRHSTAWQSLQKTAVPPRDFDPECISCHVVGWKGVENFPYIGGFDTEKTTPHLKNVGCESCHGPGSKHMEAELGDNESLMIKIRDEMRLGKNVKNVCYSCHDNDNSPAFDFDSYYKIIEHKEKESEK